MYSKQLYHHTMQKFKQIGKWWDFSSKWSVFKKKWKNKNLSTSKMSTGLKQFLLYYWKIRGFLSIKPPPIKSSPS